MECHDKQLKQSRGFQRPWSLPEEKPAAIKEEYSQWAKRAVEPPWSQYLRILQQQLRTAIYPTASQGRLEHSLDVTNLASGIQGGFITHSEPRQMELDGILLEQPTAQPDRIYERAVRRAKALRSSEAKAVLGQLKAQHQIPYDELSELVEDTRTLVTGISYLYAADWVTLGKTKLKLNPRYSLDTPGDPEK